MDIRVVEDEATWNRPLETAANSQLLQSWEWGVFQQAMGRPVHRIQVYDGPEVAAAMQLFEHRLPFGQCYAYAPRGPVFFSDSPERHEIAARQLRKLLLRLAEGCAMVFARVEPVVAPTEDDTQKDDLTILNEALRPIGFRDSRGVQPEHEYAVEVTKSEDELLAAMHEKTRYNIRLAERKGVQIRVIDDPNEAAQSFSYLWELLQGTAVRQQIRLHDRRHYRQMVDVLMSAGRLKLLLAEADGTMLAGHLLGFFGDTVSYLHGGSSYAYRSLMAPHLLHWEGIQLAKSQGKTFYNFGGVAPEGATHHKWSSLTRFKEGFGEVGDTGKRFVYLGGLELVHQSFWYWLYQLGHLVRHPRIRKKRQ